MQFKKRIPFSHDNFVAYKMAMFTLQDARNLRKSILDSSEEQAQQIAEDLRMQSKTLDEVLASIKHWIQNYPKEDTFLISVLSHPIVDMHKVNRIGGAKINKKVLGLLKDKYREAFPDFEIVDDTDRNFVFYMRVTY